MKTKRNEDQTKRKRNEDQTKRKRQLNETRMQILTYQERNPKGTAMCFSLPWYTKYALIEMHVSCSLHSYT